MGKIKFKCIVPACKSTYIAGAVNNLHFFAFPFSDIEKNRWIEAINSFSPTEISADFKTGHICQNHFSNNCFTSTQHSRIHKYVVPTLFSGDYENVDNVNIFNNPAILSDQSICRKRKRVDSSCFPVERLDDTSEPKRHHPAALLPLGASKSGNTMLKKIGCSRIKNLTHRKKKMYYINRSQQQIISKLKFHLRKVTDVKKKVKILAQNKVIQYLEKNFNSVGTEFISSQFKNIKKRIRLGQLIIKLLLLHFINVVRNVTGF
jgi:hypothetical protein